MQSTESSAIHQKNGGNSAEGLAILNSIARQRATSTYFFIAINVAMAAVNFSLVSYCLSDAASLSQKYFGFAIAASFAFVGLPLGLYWARELRELSDIEQTMYQALMDQERIYSDRGTLSRYWDRIGDRPGRTSAVFDIRHARMLPMLFMCLQIVPLYVILALSLYSNRLSTTESSRPFSGAVPEQSGPSAPVKRAPLATKKV